MYLQLWRLRVQRGLLFAEAEQQMMRHTCTLKAAMLLNVSRAKAAAQRKSDKVPAAGAPTDSVSEAPNSEESRGPSAPVNVLLSSLCRCAQHTSQISAQSTHQCVILSSCWHPRAQFWCCHSRPLQAARLSKFMAGILICMLRSDTDIRTAALALVSELANDSHCSGCRCCSCCRNIFPIR